MLASAELQSKLLRRLRIQHEDALNSSPVQRLLCPPLFAQPQPPREEPEAKTVVPSEATSLEAGLEAEIRAVLAQRDAAIKRQRDIEAASVTRGIETGAEVARLRVDAEVLSRGLESASSEVNRLRAGQHLKARSDRLLQEKAVQAGDELAAVQARKKSLAEEVQLRQAETTALTEKVRSLEEAVAKEVVNRVKLEALLRQSESREAELRRAVEVAEAGPVAGGVSKTFSLDDDDEEVSGEHDVVDDLEFSYEGLELSGLMSLDRALQLARRGTGTDLGVPMEDLSDSLSETTALEAQYEEPLRALELALAKLQNKGNEPLGPEEALQTETGQYEEHIGQLQDVLSRMSSPEKPPPEPQDLQPEAEPEELAAPLEEPQTSAPAPVFPPGQALSAFSLFSPYAALGRKYGSSVRQD